MVGAALSTTSFSAMLKEMYKPELLQEMIFDAEDDPFYEALRKDTSAGGTQIKWPVVTSTNARISHTFTTAQNMDTNTKSYNFNITGVQTYCFASWSTNVLRQSDDDRKAFVRAVKQEMDLAVAALKMKLVTELYRTGTGAITTVSTASGAVANDKIILKNPSDVLMFEVGDQVVASQTDGGSLRGGTAATVLNIDPINGYLSGAFSNITSLTARRLCLSF